MKIRREHLLPGSRGAIANSREFLQSSLSAVDDGLLRPAAGSFILGAQEIGKAKLLRDAYDSGETEPDVPVYDHNAKVRAAQTLMGSSALWLTDPAFQRSVFQANAIRVGVPADEPTRLEVTYTNYGGSTGWSTPPSIDPAALRGHVADALANLPKYETELGLNDGGKK